LVFKNKIEGFLIDLHLDKVFISFNLPAYDETGDRAEAVIIRSFPGVVNSINALGFYSRNRDTRNSNAGDDQFF
jgi:hypothetical protein